MQGVLHLCCLNGWFWGGRVWWVYYSFLLPKCFGHSNPSCKLKYFVSLNMIVVPPTQHAILSLLFRGQRARDAEKLFTGPRSCCNYSELQIQGTEMHSFFNNLLCVCVYLQYRVFHSRGLSPGPPLLMSPGYSSSLSNQPMWTKGKYPWAPTQNQRHRSWQNLVKTGRSFPEERKCIRCEAWSYMWFQVALRWLRPVVAWSRISGVEPRLWWWANRILAIRPLGPLPTDKALAHLLWRKEFQQRDGK